MKYLFFLIKDINNNQSKKHLQLPKTILISQTHTKMNQTILNNISKPSYRIYNGKTQKQGRSSDTRLSHVQLFIRAGVSVIIRNSNRRDLWRRQDLWIPDDGPRWWWPAAGENDTGLITRPRQSPPNLPARKRRRFPRNSLTDEDVNIRVLAPVEFDVCAGCCDSGVLGFHWKVSYRSEIVVNGGVRKIANLWEMSVDDCGVSISKMF